MWETHRICHVTCEIHIRTTVTTLNPVYNHDYIQYQSRHWNPYTIAYSAWADLMVMGWVKRYQT